MRRHFTNLEPLETADGSLTFFSQEYKEPFHSVTAGAKTEAVEKFIKPLGVHLARFPKILEIGFGLGVNVFETLKLCQSPFIVSVEKDISVLEKALKELKLPKEHKTLLQSLLENKRREFGFDVLTFEQDEKVLVKVFIADARDVLKSLLSKFSGYFDFVYHDAFSLKVNPELWSVEFFSLQWRLLRHGGALATYSASSSVRKALFMAGFFVKEGVRVGRKSASTVALKTKKGGFESERLAKRVLKAVALRDPNLKGSRADLLLRKSICENILRKDFEEGVLKFESSYSWNSGRWQNYGFKDTCQDAVF